MLHILIGEDRAVLSERIMGQLCHEEPKKENARILLVPEQFSHEAERRLCQAGGDTISRYAEVLSFSRMADRVAEAYGGVARSYLDQGGRILTMAMAAEQVVSRIKHFAAVLRRPEFLSEIVDMVDEFQSYCLQPADLLKASERMEGQFAQKLEELGLLYEGYLAVCANGSADPAGKLLWLCEALSETDWVDKRSFYLDGFADFTGAELTVVETLLRHSCHVWICLPAGEGLQTSQPAADTVRTLEKLAEKWEIPSERIAVKGSGGSRHEDITALLRGMFASGAVVPRSSRQVRFASFSSVEEECRHAIAEVKRLLSEGNRCRDIALGCTDTASYEAALRSALRAADLPFYFAGKDDILEKPVIGAVMTALAAAVGPMDYDDVSVYLKSGLPLVDRDICHRLDGYAYRWNLRGNQWELPWELHPGGFGETWKDEDHLYLETLNRHKTAALSPLFHLRTGLYHAANTGEMVVCFYHFLEELQLRQRLEEQANEKGGQVGQELLQLYDILCSSLEQTWLTVGSTVRTPDDFVRLYRVVLSQYHVATIPAGIDQVYVGALEDMRQKSVKHLLVLGAADGNFPPYKTGEGLLTEEERKQLLAQGLSLSPLRSDQMEHEMSRIFSALSAAQESIWFSYAGDQPAWLYRRAQAMYPQSVISGRAEVFLNVADLAAWRIRNKDKSKVSLPQLDDWEKNLKSLRNYTFQPLSRETVQGLYGKKIYLSASRIDKYAACRFAFFLAYGLKAQPQKQAKLDPSVFGTFVHAVLENTVLRINQEGGFRQVTEERLAAVATEEINAYASMHFPKQAERSAYLFRRSRQEIMEIVLDLGEELRRSLFQPADCELEFSGNGALPAIEVEGKDISCSISGFVDRVDLYEADGIAYVRVVDYKTGYKDFDYTDILNGAGLQLLIYLFALKNHGGRYYGFDRLVPSGVLYLPARRQYTLTPPMPQDEVVVQYHRDERRRKGLIRGDDDLLAAMEEDPEDPKFMPYTVGKNGKDGNLADQRQMELLERHVLRTLSAMTDAIGSGQVTPNPIVRGQDSSCRFCDYKSICHMDLCGHTFRPMASTTAEKFWEKLEQEDCTNG